MPNDNRVTRRALLAGAALLAAGRGQSQEGTEIEMFDGSSLQGWSVRQGPASAFRADKQTIVIDKGAGYPSWLRFDRRFENFDFRCEFFVEGWSNSGIYFSAPEHGRPAETGFKLNLFQKRDTVMRPESVGAIFPVVPPLRINVRSNAAWNTLRIRLDWPKLQVWMNEEVIQNLSCDAHPELRHRLRSGYIGIESLGYPLRFRNLRVTELAPKEQWLPLYFEPADLQSKWTVVGERGKWISDGAVLRADGDGYLASRESFSDFELQCYIRGSRHHNGGIIFRGGMETDSHYEIQLHDVEGAVYPTGSLYGFQRSRYPRIEAEQWFPFQLHVRGSECVVRINGDTVVEYKGLTRTAASPVMLQAHHAGRWIEYKEIRVKRV